MRSAGGNPSSRNSIARALALWTSLPLLAYAQSPPAPSTGPATDLIADLKPLIGAALEYTRVRAEAGPPSIFVDDFSRSTLDPRKWDRAEGAVIVPRPGGGLGLRLSPAEGAGELRSVEIDLRGRESVELICAAQPISGAAAALVIEYLATDHNWRQLERLAPAALDATTAAVTLPLPRDALHAGFVFRLRAQGDADWRIDRVALQTPRDANTRTLVVDSAPVWGAAVQIVCDDDPRQNQAGAALFARALSSKSPISLVASAELGGWVFDHWEIAGVAQPPLRRAAALDPNTDATAVAHFRRKSDGETATLAIRSSPVGGVRVALACAPGPAFDELATDAAVRCLVGETLVLTAAPRTNRLVFSHWTLDGRAFPAGQNVLSPRIEGDSTAVAVYAVLGDLNNDADLDTDDVDVFVLALIAPEEYARQFPTVEPARRGDVNADGAFDERDIEAFVDLLMRE